MHAKQAIRIALDQAKTTTEMILNGLSDAEMLTRAVPGMNHPAWQLGHLVSSEQWMVHQVKPNSMPPLPAGFNDRYNPKMAGSDEKTGWLGNAELLKLAAEQRAGTLKVLDQLTDAELEAARPGNAADDRADQCRNDDTHRIALVKSQRPMDRRSPLAGQANCFLICGRVGPTRSERSPPNSNDTSGSPCHDATVVAAGDADCRHSGCEPGQDKPPEDSIQVEVRGTLETGIAAIGGETTGTIIRSSNVTWELDLSGDPKLAALAEKLNKQKVVVSGAYYRRPASKLPSGTLSKSSR